MVDADIEWAIDKVAEFIEVLDMTRVYWNDDTRREPFENDANVRLSTVIRIAEKWSPGVIDGLRVLDGGSYAWRHKTQRQSAQIDLGQLQDAEDVAAHLQPHGPQLAAEDLHPWIWNAGIDLWANGHRRAAVQAAATALFDMHLPSKLGRARDTRGGADLMGQAFSLRDPELGAPRLRIPGYDKSLDEKSWNSAHEGAMHLGQGCSLAIRNRTTHDLTELDEQLGLEMLAALSLVARLVDQSEVVTA